MIKPGTLCLIVRAPAWPRLVGKQCTVTGRIGRDNYGHDCTIEVPADPRCIYGADECLLPLTPPPAPVATDNGQRVPSTTSDAGQIDADELRMESDFSLHSVDKE